LWVCAASLDSIVFGAIDEAQSLSTCAKSPPYNGSMHDRRGE
jgi:hypothetical protein